MQVTHLAFEKFYWLAGLQFSQLQLSVNIRMTVCNIILIPIAYATYLVRAAYAIDIIMILCTVIPMFVDKEKNQWAIGKEK